MMTNAEFRRQAHALLKRLMDGEDTTPDEFDALIAQGPEYGWVPPTPEPTTPWDFERGVTTPPGREWKGPGWMPTPTERSSPLYVAADARRKKSRAERRREKRGGG